MTTFNQVIDDLCQTEKPFYCIFSDLGTIRCTKEIPREQLENTPPLINLIAESNYDVLRLNDQVFSRLLCVWHQNMDIIQQIMQSWLWDQDAMHLSMPGNEMPTDSRNNLDISVTINSSAPSAPRSPLESVASSHTTLSTLDSRISPSAASSIQEDITAYDTTDGRRSAGGSSSSQQPRRYPQSRRFDPSSLQGGPIDARVKRRSVMNEAQRIASAPNILTSQLAVIERPPAPSRTALSDQILSSSGNDFSRPTSRTHPPPLEPTIESDENGDDIDAMSIDSVGEITPLPSNIQIPPSTNRRSNCTASRIQDAHSIDDALRMKIKEVLPKKDKQRGYVYIFRDPARPDLLKIGKTDLEVSKRRENIERRCRITLETVYQEGDGEDLLPLRNCQRAEQLVHKELANYNRRHFCPTCKEWHKEWFEVSEDLAKKSVHRWVSFIRKLPYDENGVLNDFWQKRLYRMTRPTFNEKPEDHDIRHERWNFVITATRFHFWWHWVYKTIFAVPERDRPGESLYLKLVRFRWQLFAEFLSLVLGVLSFPSVTVSVMFVIITFLVFFEFLRG